jgi:hypothetical protein
MSKQQFTIPYNGDNVEVTVLNDDSFLVQITYKPLLIKRTLDENGEALWLDSETNVKTNLSVELGNLITKKHPFMAKESSTAV